MRLRITIVSLMAFALVAFLLTGCTDKTKNNPTAPNYKNGVTYGNGFSSWAILFSSMADSVMSETGFKPALIYMPPDYDPDNPSARRYPVLYLLPPFGADGGYYFEHGLADVADRLISEGKIKPMIIVSFDGRSALGGSFYVNSARQGNFFTAMYKDTTFPGVIWNKLVGTVHEQTIENLPAPNLLSIIDGTYPTIQDRRCRGIGGVGMGGYGAFMSAVKTDNFSSVSAIDAPLDFDGTGSGGFLHLFTDVTDAFSDTSWAANMDTSRSEPAKTLIISAAAAFSPQETEIGIDSVYVNTLGMHVVSHVVDSLTDDMTSYLPKYRVHLPFDSNAALNTFIWDKWMENNIDYLYLYEAVDAEHFRTMSKLLMKSNAAYFHYDEQMDAFSSFMRANDISYEEKTFTLPGGVHANVDYQMYDLLEDILIFHSENFVGEGDL